MAQLKCPACDGYGTRPSRKTPGKFVKCKPCKALGLLWQPDAVIDFLRPVPPVVLTPPVDTLQPFPWLPPGTTVDWTGIIPILP